MDKLYIKYKQYLLSDDWANMKLDLIQAKNSTCDICNTKVFPLSLRMRHTSFDRLYNEEPEDLELVCKKCYKKSRKK